MADNYTHQYNAYNALEKSGYQPRNLNSFIMGANGPDPLFCYQMYNPLRKYDLSRVAGVMHREKTGKFLREMFTRARTDEQKDYCLGFLCHYSLDSVIHPYVQYATESYGSPFNIPSGHQFFETAIDSLISLRMDGEECADYEAYCPPLTEMELHQISHLLREAVYAAYDKDIPQGEYIQAFKDFALIKKFFYSPAKLKFPLAYILEKVLGFEEGYVKGHMQPSTMKVADYPFWENLGIGLYSVESLEDLLSRADYLSAQCLDYGLKYFAGVYTIDDLLEDIGNNKSYETGLTIPE